MVGGGCIFYHVDHNIQYWSVVKIRMKVDRKLDSVVVRALTFCARGV